MDKSELRLPLRFQFWLEREGKYGLYSALYFGQYSSIHTDRISFGILSSLNCVNQLICFGKPCYLILDDWCTLSCFVYAADTYNSFKVAND